MQYPSRRLRDGVVSATPRRKRNVQAAPRAGICFQNSGIVILRPLITIRSSFSVLTPVTPLSILEIVYCAMSTRSPSSLWESPQRSLHQRIRVW